MSKPPVAALVNDVIAAFVARMLQMARARLEGELRHFAPSEAGDERFAEHLPPEVPPPPPTRPILEARAAAPVRVVRASEHVDRLVELVSNHPWPPKSRELQLLLGVKKDPFLRIADLAIATGRITRSGQRSGVRYHPVESGGGADVEPPARGSGKREP